MFYYSGLDHLHQYKCLHRDLATRNILLVSYQSKIDVGDEKVDFGVFFGTLVAANKSLKSPFIDIDVILINHLIQASNMKVKIGDFGLSRFGDYYIQNRSSALPLR